MRFALGRLSHDMRMPSPSSRTPLYQVIKMRNIAHLYLAPDIIITYYGFCVATGQRRFE